jgi:hypothetical protein
MYLFSYDSILSQTTIILIFILFANCFLSSGTIWYFYALEKKNIAEILQLEIMTLIKLIDAIPVGATSIRPNA